MLRTSKSSRRRTVPLLATAAAVLATAGTVLPAGAATPAAAAMAQSGPSTLWATQLQFDDHGTPWSTAQFEAVKAKGMNSVEINMPWNQIEPAQGSYDFTELDTELANAEAAGIRIVPIFWQAGWGGSPASWITSKEITSSGGTGIAPAWWDTGEQQAYFDYVTTTVRHITGNPGYGGSILNYGRLDAQWSNNGNGGWAPADVAHFHDHWLPHTYGTVVRFNAANGTSYGSFAEVPAATPGEPLAGVYQNFRQWSVQDTYDRLTAAVRKVSSGPLYYYFGGHISNAPDIGNLPDIFFSLARRYDLTVIEDAAQSPGLTLTFGSLARGYHVRLAQEWTAPTEAEMPAQAVQWISNYGMGFPYGGGEDFFIHDGTSKDVIAYPIYTGALPTLQSLSGSYPQAPVAVYFDYSKAWGNAAGGSLNAVENQLTALWSRHQSGFAVVTSDEVKNHAADLSKFRAVLPLNGTDANVTAYRQAGGTVLSSGDQLTRYAPAYAELSSAHALQVVPTTAADHRSAQLVLAEINPYFPYDGAVVLRPGGLGLKAGRYHAVDAATGKALPQVPQSDGGACVPLGLGTAELREWKLVPGPAPAGTPVPGSCSTTSGGATTVGATAGGNDGSSGAVFQNVGATGQGADGNLDTVTLGGQSAYETWTTDRTGVGSANAYLQLDPGSAVARAATVTVQVTYWSEAGQGFTVQYDTPTDAYHNGPTVTGDGTGSWQTATLTLTGAQFDEAQNLQADLRLAATDPAKPLYIHSVSLTTAGN
ncbi:beta-galactosidase [Streptomyces sp. 900105755]